MLRLHRLLPVLGLVLAFGWASPGDAQIATERQWWVQGAVGVAFPTGTYANTTNPGVGFAAVAAYNFKPKWSALGAVNLALLKGELGPDTNIYTYFLKAAYDISDVGSQWRIMIPLGAGGATFAPKDADSKTYFALNSGLMFQYYFNPRWAVTLDGQATLVFAEETRLGSSTIWIFPIAAGMLVRF